MVLMPQSNLAAAKSLAEKLRQAISQYRFDKADTITVSLGVTELAPQDNPNSFPNRVDDMLYQAKRLERNRVEAR